MKYCMRCGVKVDENKNRYCPLCETIILSDNELDILKKEKKEFIVKPKKTVTNIKVKEQINIRGIIYYFFLILNLLGIFTLFIIDLASGFNLTWSKIPLLSIITFHLLFVYPLRKRKKLYYFITFDTIVLCLYFILLNYFISNSITWSYYVILALLLLWVYLTLIYVNKIKSIIIKILFAFIATAIFVLLVILGTGNESAFGELALPLNGLVFLLIIITYLFIKTYIYNWFAIIAILSINISILCLGIDLLIYHFKYDGWGLKWSYIVLIVLVPFSLLMSYLNNRYKIHNYLIKKFHI